MKISGYVEVEPDLFAPGAIEAACKRFLEAKGEVIFHYDPTKRLGTVTRMVGNGDRIEIEATLEEPPPRTELRDAYNKIGSGTVKGLALAGDFTRARAQILAVVVTGVPIDGSGYITEVSK